MKLTYDQLKQTLESNGGLGLNTQGGVPPGTPIQGTFTGTVTIDVPQLPKIEFPMEDLNFGTSVIGSMVGKNGDVNTTLAIKGSDNGVKTNAYAGSQIILNSDRLLLNARTNYLMLFGQQGVALSSQGSVNIDAEDSITLFAGDGLFLGVPNQGEIDKIVPVDKQKKPATKADPTVDFEYEPVVLGTKLANLIEDLLVILKNATLLTPVGKGYFREDVMYELACLQARIPEMLSTYAYVDGWSHEGVDPAPEPPKTVTEPPTTLVGTVTGTFTGTTGAIDPNAPSNVITNPLADQPDFFDTETLYGDEL